MTEPEKTRWVRYAADCAERVIDLAAEGRGWAEACIRAARAWADDPSSESLAWEARALHRRTSTGNNAVYAAACAARSAGALSSLASINIAKDAAVTAAGAAHLLSLEDYAAMLAWQEERRRFYGLSKANRQVK